MREDLGPRLLEYLRAALQNPRVDFAEPLVPVSGGFLRGYRRRRPLAARPFAYYEALACMRGLVRAAEHRAGARAAANPLDASSFGDRLVARFANLTGIRPDLGPTNG